jgi:putative endonuclease
MLFTVYILYSTSFGKIYIGYTSHLLLRFKSHQELGKGWTSKYRPWLVIYCEYYADQKKAMQREKELKSGQGRKWIRDKINSQFSRAGFISA